MVSVVVASPPRTIDPPNSGRLRRILFAAIGSALVAVSVSGQTIVIDTPMADAGTVQRGTAITKEFVVKNTGSAPLRIADVKPACGCMRAKFDKTIAPGGTGKIFLTVDTKSFRSAISKSAVVLSNDSATPEVSLIVVANVRGLVTAEPSESLRIQTTKGHLGKAQVVLTSEDAAFKPTEISTTEPYLRAVLNPDTEPGKWKVRVFSDSKAPAGPIHGEVVLKTGIPEEPEFRIPVSGVIMSVGGAATGAVAESAISNDEVMKLVAADLGDEIVIAKIKNAAVARLDVSTDALVALKDKKVSKAVITAIIERAGQPDKTSAASPSSPSASAAPKPTGPCEGVELLGFHKEDFRPVSPLILYFAKVRNGTSMTKIVSVEWTNLYGERIRNTAEVGAGQIATLQLAAQQTIERMPIDLRLGTCR